MAIRARTLPAFSLFLLMFEALSHAGQTPSVHLLSSNRSIKFKAVVTEEGGDSKTPLYFFEAEKRVSAERTVITGRYLDPSVKPALEESVTIEGGRTVKYDCTDHTRDELSWFRVVGDQATLRFRKRGKESSAQVRLNERPVVAGPGILQFIWDNRTRLNLGETVEFDYPVMDRLQLMRFLLSKKKVIPVGDDFHYVIEMKIGNLLFRPFVPYQYFKVDFDNQRVISVSGRFPLQTPSGRDPNEGQKGFVALTTFTEQRFL
jgi:hypothetical protein